MTKRLRQELPVSSARPFDKCSWLRVRSAVHRPQLLLSKVHYLISVHFPCLLSSPCRSKGPRWRGRENRRQHACICIFSRALLLVFPAKEGPANPLISLKLGPSRPFCYAGSLLINCCIIMANLASARVFACASIEQSKG